MTIVEEVKYCVGKAIQEQLELTPKGEPILLDPGRIGSHINKEDIGTFLKKLESDENVIKIISSPRRGRWEYHMATSCDRSWKINVLEGFDEFYQSLSDITRSGNSCGKLQLIVKENEVRYSIRGEEKKLKGLRSDTQSNAIMQYLNKNPNRIINKKEINDHLPKAHQIGPDDSFGKIITGIFKENNNIDHLLIDLFFPVRTKEDVKFVPVFD